MLIISGVLLFVSFLSIGFVCVIEKNKFLEREEKGYLGDFYKIEKYLKEDKFYNKFTVIEKN